MHRLERLACREADDKKRAEIPELPQATVCLRRHMIRSDWEVFETFNKKLEAPDTIGHFLVLRNWLVEATYLVEWGKSESAMETWDLREEAEKLGRDLKRLSRELASTFPELCGPQSIHRLIQPASWANHLDWTEPAGYELWQISGQVEGGLRSLSANDLTPSVAGKNSLLENLSSYVARYGTTLRSPPKRRVHPIWCSYATKRLRNTLDRSDFFEHAKPVEKSKIIEFTIQAVADFQNLETPHGWGVKEIEDSLRRPVTTK